MVSTDYHGRTGNNIFQYVFARILAQKNKLMMATNFPHQYFLKTTAPAAGHIVEGKAQAINDLYWAEHDQDWLQRDWQNKRVHCSGFFQNPTYYDDNKSMTKSFFDLPVIRAMPKNAIVMHCRLGDYHETGLRSVINPIWYLRILKFLLK